MKRIKYITAFLLIFSGVLFCGELRIREAADYRNGVGDNCRYLISDDKWQEAGIRIDELAAENDVAVFTLDYIYETLTKETINIYVTSGDEETVRRALDLKSLKLKSLFSGSFEINFLNIRELTCAPKSGGFSMIGDEKAIEALNGKLKAYYEMESYYAAPKAPDYETKYKKSVAAFWLVIAAFLSFMSVYDCLRQKKEVFIGMTLGRSITSFVIKNILYDSVFYCLALAFSVFVLNFVNSSFDYIMYYCVALAAIIVLNAVIFLGLYSINVKSAVGKNLSVKVLKYNYFIKVISVLATVICLAMAFSTAADMRKYLYSDEFFRTFKEYEYVTFQYSADSNLSNEGIILNRQKNNFMNYQIYKDYYDVCKPLKINKYGEDLNMIYASSTSAEYFKTVFDDLDFYNMDCDSVVIVPESLKAQEDKIMELAKEALASNEFYGSSVKLLYYDKNVKCTCINTNTDEMFEVASNPVVVFNKKNLVDVYGEAKLSEDEFFSMPQGIMYMLNDEIKNEIIERFDLKNHIYITTNLYDHYLYVKRNEQFKMLSLVSVALLLFVLNTIVNYSILKLEFRVNSMEISLKKILGHSLLQIYFDIIMSSIFTVALGVIGLIIAGLFIEALSVFDILIAGLIISVYEIILIIAAVKKSENSEIQKALKGGSL